MKSNVHPELLLAALDRIGSGKVLVTGDVMLDRYWYGDTTRISPEAPVPVVKIGEAEERPGGTANVAVNIARLGTACSLIALTGDDNAATTLESKIKTFGVRCLFQKVQNSRTISKLRVISRQQQLIRLDFEDGFPDFNSSILSDVFDEELQHADIIVISDYAKGTLKDTTAWIQKIRAANKPVVIDPKGSDFSKYKGATIVTPNLSEFEAVAGSCATKTDLIEKGKKLRAKLELEALLITRGEKGMLLIEAEKEALCIPTEARDVFDVTGAGDTVVALLAAGLAAGIDIPTSVRLANCAAGLVVAKLGTAAVSRNEIRRALSFARNTAD